MMLGVLVLAPLAVVLGVAVWNALSWPGVGNPPAPRGKVSILVPARDEESRLPACLETLAAQGSEVAEILVYDDHSSDGTADVVRRGAARDSRIGLVPPVPLEEGWSGKSFACARLASAASGEWLLFVDADIRLAPGAAGRIAGEAARLEATLLSCWPGIEMVGFWEKLLMPLLNFVVFTLYPAPLSFRRDDSSLGLAHGACVLARRDVYERTGGHRLVAAEMFEDTQLSRAWRNAGERSLCLDGQRVVGVRMYGSLAEIWQGFQKNFYPAFRREASFWIFLAFHAAFLFAPFVVAPFRLAAGAGQTAAAAAALVLAARLTLAARFRHPWWSALLHPLGELLLLARGLSSWWTVAAGRGVTWKGRSYRQR